MSNKNILTFIMNDMTLGKDNNLIRIDEIIWVNKLFLYI